MIRSMQRLRDSILASRRSLSRTEALPFSAPDGAYDREQVFHEVEHIDDELAPCAGQVADLGLPAGGGLTPTDQVKEGVVVQGCPRPGAYCEIYVAVAAEGVPRGGSVEDREGDRGKARPGEDLCQRGDDLV